MKYAIAIHGGAGSSPDMFSPEGNLARRKSMEQALTIGNDILKKGGAALDAVEQVVVYLENDPQFNAGVGAVFNAVGSHELDASIMDGSNLGCGAVAGVSHVKNPISLARLVMTGTSHVMLSGTGAEDFAREMKVEMVEPEHFDTPKSKEAWERTKIRLSQLKPGEPAPKAIEEIGASQIGTVGCVALDSHGNVAAATSTGGMSNKKYGRIGDSPVIGAGTYADNKTVAVSCTGNGEEFIRHVVAAEVAAQIRYKGCTAAEAVAEMLNNRLQPDDGGIIAVCPNGEITMQFSTKGMARATADSSGRFEVLWDENYKPAGESSNR